jgi:hypothetical protein
MTLDIGIVKVTTRSITETGKGTQYRIKAEDPNGNKFTFKVDETDFDEYQIGKIIELGNLRTQKRLT